MVQLPKSLGGDDDSSLYFLPAMNPSILNLCIHCSPAIILLILPENVPFLTF
jgi:hypothetical protein